MRQLLIALLVVLLASPLAMAQGVDKGQIEVSVGGGLSLPMGDFGDAYKTGFLGGLSVGYYVTPVLVIGAEGNYYMYKAKDELIDAAKLLDPTVTDMKFSTIQATAYGKYLFKPENMSPYVKGIVGMYSDKAKVEAGSGDADVSESDIGFGAGAGVQLKGQGNVGGFGEVLFHDILTEGSSTTFIEFKVGATFFLGKK